MTASWRREADLRPAGIGWPIVPLLWFQCWLYFCCCQRHMFSQNVTLLISSRAVDFLPYIFELFPVSTLIEITFLTSRRMFWITINTQYRSSYSKWSMCQSQSSPCFPQDRDVCVIMVPQLAPEFPLLQSFIRVVPRLTSILPQELYIFHRSGLLK